MTDRLTVTAAGETATVDFTVPTRVYPKIASPMANSGETWAAAAVRTLGYGYNGVVRYFSGAPSWDAQLSALAAAHPGPMFLQVTAKTHSDAGLAAILKAAPAAWSVTYNIFQEPEDNLTTAAQQAQYRADYAAAAKVCRTAGAGLPWVEWQEWTLDPTNTKGWNLANFTPATGDFGGVLWSLFEYGEKAPPADRLAAQIARITAAMAKYAPGQPWALMAAAYTLEPAAGPFTTVQLAAQAAWMQKSYDLTRAAGSTGWAWFDYQMAGTGGASGEARVSANPTALATLKKLT